MGFGRLFVWQNTLVYLLYMATSSWKKNKILCVQACSRWTTKKEVSRSIYDSPLIWLMLVLTENISVAICDVLCSWYDMFDIHSVCTHQVTCQKRWASHPDPTQTHQVEDMGALPPLIERYLNLMSKWRILMMQMLVLCSRLLHQHVLELSLSLLYVPLYASPSWGNSITSHCSSIFNHYNNKK